MVIGIDIIGGLLVGACIAVGAWFALGPPKDAAASLGPRKAEASALESDVSRIRMALRQARNSVEEARKKVDALGSLPQSVPIERDLDALAGVARSCHLTIGEVAPHATVDYPGVRELQYSIKGEGTFPDWMTFLRAFEEQSCWADVTHMKLEARKQSSPVATPRPRAELTISFYAACENEIEEAEPTKR
jgi:hypothetical protein